MALNKLEIPTTDPETNSRSPKLGTRWVAPGEGSTWRELGLAFLPLTGRLGIPLLSLNHVNARTNLLLTDLPLQEADRERWESGNVR